MLSEDLRARHEAYLKWKIQVENEKKEAKENNTTRGDLRKKRIEERKAANEARKKAAIAAGRMYKNDEDEEDSLDFAHLKQMDPNLSERKMTDEMWDQLVAMRKSMVSIQEDISSQQKSFDSLDHVFRHILRKVKKRDDIYRRAKRANRRCCK